ncbi:MAG: histidinol-phosphatase [Silicimonas sp.]|nr:histidinol-phosphatase [Silicimonas sp.]
MNETSDFAQAWAIADKLADAARVETLKYFRTATLETQSKKAAFDPVTVADKNAEAAMRAILAEARPDDGILGEEHGAVEGTSGLTWVLDPIDGTRGFISGSPTWGVLIALSDENGPLLGLIDQPYISERFWGGPGRAETKGPLGTSPLKTKGTTSLAQATLFSTYPEIGTQDERVAFERVAAEVQLTRFGCDCYAYAMLAAGHIDLVIEAGLQPYDIQAPIAVVQAAGGMVTDWQGRPAHNGGTAIAAATPELHAAALGLLA